MSDMVYELSNYDYMYDRTFYYHFKKDDTMVSRIKTFIRSQLRYDSGYFEDDERYNIEALHMLKGVSDLEGITPILEKVGWYLEEKELL